MTRPRWFLPLLLVLTAFTARADFYFETFSSRTPIDGALPLRVNVVNATASEAHDVRVDFNGGAVPVASPEWHCAASSCTLTHSLAPGASAVLEVRFRIDAPYGRKSAGFFGRADVGPFAHPFVIDGVALYRRFVVTQAGDSGAGSLRAAIEALNGDEMCATVPCAIDFDIDSPDAVKRIALRSPLPRIARPDVLVDGSSQTAAHGDTNPLGPEIEIDGAAAGLTNGLDFAVDRAEVVGLALGNFGDNAILVRNHVRTRLGEPTPLLYVSRSHIGVDATGLVPMPNFRGISLSPGWFDGGVIRDNVISHNIRSGYFDWSNHDPGFPTRPILTFSRNHIDRNGASGIFLGEGSDGALLRDNVIEHNAEMGVAIARGAFNVLIMGNSIAHNGGSAIDVGLDGPAQAVARPKPSDRIAPLIESAVYDPATNTTTVKGKPSVTPILTNCDFCRTDLVSLYANDAAEHGEYAEAQTYLGEAQPNGDGFVFIYAGDLRGKYLTALDTGWVNLEAADLFNAGELSKAFLVR